MYLSFKFNISFSYISLLFSSLALYLIGKRNGKGKEYNYGELIYEGEYLNGQRWNGKGKEYKYGELIYKSEYLNGKNIKVKKYILKNILINLLKILKK